MDFKIDKMSLEDLISIKDILTTEFDDFWNYEILKSELESNNSYFFVAKNISGEIVGFAGIKIILDEADIMNIVIKKDFRNNGIGSLLLDYLISYSKSINLKTITLEVNEINIPAIKLYEKFDFEKLGIRKKYYNGKNDAIIMSKKIKLI
ncbi:MAG: ribosomal protein S18-alanine N-acetyltransferase [Clostridia bacterium]